MQARGIKVLSLFFIDRVANYRDYDDRRQPAKGKFAEAFEEELAELAKEARYAPLEWLEGAARQAARRILRQGQGGRRFKDTRGDTQADDDAYNLIMKDKERLLVHRRAAALHLQPLGAARGLGQPERLPDLHARRDRRSAIKKRQEIGRGLRLPVDQTGVRVFDESINRLYVMANESYEDFARALQTEYEEDCGVTFGKVPSDRALLASRAVVGDQEVPIGKAEAEKVRAALVKAGMTDADGKIAPAFDPKKKDFTLGPAQGAGRYRARRHRPAVELPNRAARHERA